MGPFFSSPEQLIEPVIFVDAGVKYRDGVVGFSVGDGDSSTVPMDQKLSPKKNYSDLAFVLKQAPEGIKKLNLLGFLGHRLDHQLMNWAEVHRYLKKQKNQQVVCQFDQSIYAVSEGSWQLTINGLFSLFSFSEIKISLTGACDFPVLKTDNFTPLSSHGLSNNGHGEIQLINTEPLFIFTESKLLISAL